MGALLAWRFLPARAVEVQQLEAQQLEAPAATDEPTPELVEVT